MRELNLTKRLFWIIALIIISISTAISIYQYINVHKYIESRALGRAESLENYFLSMRYIYHQQFVNSGIDLNANTVGFLPAHAATFISDEFAMRNKDDIAIRNVSDRPRNPANSADKFELEAIEHFQKTDDTEKIFKKIEKNDKTYFFYAKPLVVEPYCLQCHGKKEQTLEYISREYDVAFDYSEGDIRGITSIKVPESLFDDLVNKTKIEIILYNISIIALLGLIYYVIRRFTKKDAEYRDRLTKEVKIKTKELEKSNEHQKHLYSILRTVADANQILITAESLDDLIEKMSDCLIENSIFFSVKISLAEDSKLTLKATRGLKDRVNIFPLEEYVYEHNQKIILNDFTTEVSEECKRYVKEHGVSSIYASSLKKDAYTSNPLGVILICTTQKGGFNDEEIAMIDELAGDLGFAINSFYQKDHILKLSYFDPLTDLPNRRMLLEHIEKSISNSMRNSQYNAILFVDLDNFKTINDLKGHGAGDSVLQEMSQRLKRALRHHDVISRYGGDEFVILIENLSANKDHAAAVVQKVADKILSIAQNPFVLDNQNFYISASIGMVLFNDNEKNSDKLLSSADNAMYIAKNDGRNRSMFYDSAIQHNIEMHSKMIQDLKIAASSNQLYILYQDQVDITQKIIGVEALMRWNHPELGNLSPAIFIPLAEESGVIIELGEWVINEAVNKLAEWSKDESRKDYHISVNVSFRQFNDPDFVSMLAKKVEIAGFKPNKLRLELTESLLINSVEEAMSKLEQLRDLGYTVSIDDFGTGYSSLSYLKNLPIDELKIDQSFVKYLLDSPSDQVIVQTIITIGATFNLEVIAEGVETQEQFEKLIELGCRFFQGYLFGKPKHIL